MAHKMKLWEDCTLKEKIERWENAIRVLKNLSPHEKRKHWDMSFWAKKTDCGTVACAASHCAMDRWFTRRGLVLEFREEEYRDVETGELVMEEFATVDYDDFFGYDGSDAIFCNTDPRPVSKVIREIENYVRFLKLTKDDMEPFNADKVYRLSRAKCSK